MTGEKMSRIIMCRSCRFFTTKPVAFAGPKGFPDFCMIEGIPEEISDDYLEGPVTNCRVDKWKGLVPVDLEKMKEESQARFMQSPPMRLMKEFVRVCRDQRRLDIAEELFVRAVRDLGIPEELITLVAKETNMDLGDDDGGTKLGESTPRT